MAEITEAEAIIDQAQLAVTPHTLDPGALLGIVIPDDANFAIHDLEEYLPNPRRKKGTVALHDADSFIRYVTAHRDVARTSLYANVDNASVVAILDGHSVLDTVAGWGDHRAELNLRKTPNWKHWEGKDGVWMDQTRFSEHIEDGLPDIIEPAAADMLEMAQTFQATTRVNFKTSSLLHNGQRQLTYEETIDSKAGQQGNMTMPTEMSLGVRVFEGMAEGHRVKVRIRTRIEGQTLKLCYLLDRPLDVLKDAFEQVLTGIEAETTKAFRGIAPFA